MTPKPNETAQDLSKLVEQSVSTLQEVDRRLQMVRSDLAALIGRAATMGLPPAGGLAPQGPMGAFDALGPAGLPLAGGAPLPIGFGAAGPAPSSAYGNPGAFGVGGMQGGALLGAPGAFAPAAGQQGVRSARDLANLPPIPRVPNVDLVDQGNEYVVQIELPGVKKEDLDIMVSDRTITVSGQAKPDMGDGALLLSERGPVVYRRLIPLPTEVHTTQSKATFKDGILTLTVPKKVPTEGPKRLDVAYG